MTVHFFTKGDEKLPDSYLRAFGIAQELEERGIPTVMHWPPVLLISKTPWPKKAALIIATMRSLCSIRKDNVIFLQRTISNKYFFVIIVTYLFLFKRKTIFDFDDAIYLHDFFKTKTLTKMASAVIVGGNALADWARRYNTNVHIVHTPLKLATYESCTKDYSIAAPLPVIGWVGTARNHRANLAFLADVLRILVAQAKTPFKFVLVGVWGYPAIKELFDIPGLSVEFVEYLEPQKLPQMLQSFDVGVMPLAENSEWNRARSSFKPIEYMACGLATVSGNIGAITDIVVDGENGFLAGSREEWVSKLKLLLSDPALRARLGRAGQASVRGKYCYEAVVPRMVTILSAL